MGSMQPSPARAERRTWRVRGGDALSIIAERFGVSVSDIRHWNRLDSDVIQVGQELYVAPEAEADRYRVQAGDTLSQLAERLQVSMEAILQANEGLDPNRIRIGQSIRLPRQGPRTEYRVRQGDRLTRIAKRYGVHVSEILRWNRGLDPNRLRPGQTLVLLAEPLPPPSQSVGAPNGGSLMHGVKLLPHPAYVIRNPERSYGTQETIDALQEGFQIVQRQHPGAPKVRVHDISHPAGGTMFGHRSHQSGRDVDLSLFHRRGCAESGCLFRRIHPSELDVGPQWTLLLSWLRRNRVEAAFLDYALQKPLYEEARRRGASRRQLNRWFQYPRPVDQPVGLIRHYPKHRDHVHVRFRCPADDSECR